MSDSTKVIAPPDEAEASEGASSDEAGHPVQGAVTPGQQIHDAHGMAADEEAAAVGAGTSDGEGAREESAVVAESDLGAPEPTAPEPGPSTALADASAESPAAAAEAPIADGSLDALRRARDEKAAVEGRVFGWNPGGFHVVIDGMAAFVPRSEMEIEPIADPESYLDKTFSFRVLKIQGKGRRIVLSRTALLRAEQDQQAKATVATLRPNMVVKGRVSSLTDFGAFVDIGGVEGLVHVSEISRQRVNRAAEVLQVGQEVEVKVLKVERGGKRVSLSIKALEPDPWREIRDKYPEGMIVTGKVERTDKPGAFIQLEPGLVGLLPTSEMGLPREAIPARAYPVGKEVRVQVVGVDAKRRRISLAPEGSRVEGSRGDYQAYLKQQRREPEATGFNALASALAKLKADDQPG